jgi:hypothetical protein
VSYLDDTIAHLRARQREVLIEALENVIPPWCEGVNPAFWKTQIGRELARDIWFLNKEEAITLREAVWIVFGKKVNRLASRYRMVIVRHLHSFPRPERKYWREILLTGKSDRPYFLRSEAEALRARYEKEGREFFGD